MNHKNVFKNKFLKIKCLCFTYYLISIMVYSNQTDNKEYKYSHLLFAIYPNIRKTYFPFLCHRKITLSTRRRDIVAEVT